MYAQHKADVSGKNVKKMQKGLVIEHLQGNSVFAEITVMILETEFYFWFDFESFLLLQLMLQAH